MKCFIDTNVLLYARDNTAPSKLRRAHAWLTALSERDAVVLSAQRLREYYWNLRGLDRSMAAVAALRADLASLDRFVPDLLRIDWMADAWSLQDRHGLSFPDSLLVAAALKEGCSIFLSEDMNDDQRIEGLTVVDPFSNQPGEVLVSA